jgi:asparagine synthase (glutamine-hydrolysing)
MTWIGGIFSKVTMSQDELRKKLAIMVETACPTNETSTVAYPRCIGFIIDDTHGQALAQVSIPTEGTPPEHAHPAYREGPVLIYDGPLYSLRNTASRPSRVQHRVHETAAESLAHLLADLPGNLEQKVKTTLLGLDGDYALAVGDIDRIVISRNSLGTKPLYFAENDDLSAFASNKKPLWKIGLGEVRPLRAGMLAIFDHEGVSVRKVLPLRKKAIEIRSMTRAVNAYERPLCSAVRKRLAKVNRIREVGVLLSGGVDSCLIAKLVHDAACGLGIEAIAYTAGLPDSPDVKFAREFAKELGIKHKIKILSVDAVEEYIPRVIEAIEDSDFVQVETGIGLYAAIDMASQDGIRVLFSGQGPMNYGEATRGIPRF